MMMTDMGKVYFGKRRREEEEKVRWVAGSQTPARTHGTEIGFVHKTVEDIACYPPSFFLPAYA